MKLFFTLMLLVFPKSYAAAADNKTFVSEKHSYQQAFESSAILKKPIPGLYTGDCMYLVVNNETKTAEEKYSASALYVFEDTADIPFVIESLPLSYPADYLLDINREEAQQAIKKMKKKLFFEGDTFSAQGQDLETADTIVKQVLERDATGKMINLSIFRLRSTAKQELVLQRTNFDLGEYNKVYCLFAKKNY